MSILWNLCFAVSAKVKEGDENELKHREELIMQKADKMAKANDVEGLNLAFIPFAYLHITKIARSFGVQHRYY